MAANAEEFILKLQQQVSGPAAVATSAMAQLEAKIRDEKTAIGELEAKLGTAAAKLQTIGQGVNGSVNIAAFKKQQQAVKDLQAQLDKKGAGVGALEGAKGLAAQADKLGEAGAGASLNMRALAGGLGKLGGPLGESGQKAASFVGGLQKINKALGAAGPYVAIAVAVVAIAAAFIIATVAIAKWAVGLADARRNESLAIEGLAVSSKSLGKLASILPSVQAATGLASEELRKMAESLDKGGVSAANMPGALKAIATATAGGASAEFLAKLEASLKATGKVAPELAKQMSALEAVAAKKMLSLDAQGETLKRNISAVFGGLKIDGLLGGFAKLVGLFDANTAAGKTMKFLFEGMFQPIIDGVAAALPSIERFFIIALTWAVRGYSAIKPYGPAIATVGKWFLIAAAIIGGVVAGSLALVIGFFAGAVVVILAVVAAVAAFIYMLGSNFVSVWNAVSGSASAAWAAIKGAVQSALNWLSGLSLSGIGSALIDGLVSGITGAAGAVLSAITGAVGGAIDAAKSLLGIHSPSKVFAQIGMHTSAGFAEGVDSGAPEAQTSMQSMVSPPSASGSSSKGGSKGHSFEFNNCTFGDGLDEGKLRAWLTRIMAQESLDAEPAT